MDVPSELEHGTQGCRPHEWSVTGQAGPSTAMSLTIMPTQPINSLCYTILLLDTRPQRPLFPNSTKRPPSISTLNFCLPREPTTTPWSRISVDASRTRTSGTAPSSSGKFSTASCHLHSHEPGSHTSIDAPSQKAKRTVEEPCFASSTVTPKPLREICTSTSRNLAR